jgi:hypothetical protein
VKIINEEVDESQTSIGNLRKKIEEENNKFNELAAKRDGFTKSWKNDRNLTEMHMEILHLMLRESVQIVENMDSDTKW